jgi:cell division protein FtsQ
MEREPKTKPRHAPEPAPSLTRNRVVVIGASLLSMLFAAALVWVVMATLPKKWDAAQMLPIRDVTFVGEMKHVDASELKRIAGGIRGSMLRTDLAEVKAAVKKIQWVRDADVRRRFPSTLEVSIEEHQPYAHWKSTDGEKRSVVNTRGEVFKADLDAPLPIFSGPPGSSKEVLANYSAFYTQLAAIGRVPAELTLSARRAWQMKLDNGTSLELGRSEAAERLSRYVKAYPVVAALQLANGRIDMRYQSGMAVRAALDGTPKPATKTTNKS